jgi:flagellar hook-associated protein 3 FlgL
MRVSNSMRVQMLLEQMRTNTLRLFNNQQQLATGHRLLALSDDPAAASRALDLTAVLNRQNQFQRNTNFADSMVSAADATLTSVRDVLNQASSIASRNVGVPADADQRAAAAAVVDGLISQMIAIANSQYGSIYLFAGQACDRPPFEESLGGVTYKGDSHSLVVNIDGTAPTAVSVPGDQVFGAASAAVRSWAALTPTLDADIQLSDLAGAAGDGVQLGQIVINEVGGAGPFTVDLSGASTAGDVVAAINAASTAAGASVSASLTTTGLELTAGPGCSLQVSEQGQGRTASDLGILQPTPAPSPLTGAPLQPKVTLATAVDSLSGGLGIDKTGGLQIVNGTQTTTVDLSTVQTVQDILNAINGADVGVFAQINEAGTGIDVVSRLSGGNLAVGENGGLTATTLGIRSFYGGTALATLNDGRGVETAAGADIRIVVRSGAAVDVDLDGALTVQDVLDRINAAAAAAGVALNASLSLVGNGIRLSDATVGTDTLRVERLNYSLALEDLGLDVSTSTGELVGRDVAAVHSTGVFGALVDLRTALSNNDTAGITQAGSRLEQALKDVAVSQGRVGALAQQVAAHKDRLGDAVLASQSLLSDVVDADYTEVITRYTQVQTAMQANLMTGSKLLELSLLDFLQ